LYLDKQVKYVIYLHVQTIYTVIIKNVYIYCHVKKRTCGILMIHKKILGYFIKIGIIFFNEIFTLIDWFLWI